MIGISYFLIFMIFGVNPNMKKIVEKMVPRVEYEKVDTSWFEVLFPMEFGVVKFRNKIEPITIQNGHFIGKISKRRVRFFGTTIGWDFILAPDSIIEKSVKYLGSLGINCVRIHPIGIWNYRSKSLNEKLLERLDFLTSELRKNGIYYSFYTPIICISSGQDSLPINLYRGLALLDENKSMETREFWKQLLLHRNKYTGIRYYEDPALVFLIISNEYSVSKLWYQKGGIDILRPFWARYLKSKGLPYVEIPEKKTEENFDLFLKFSAEMDSIYFMNTKRFLRSIGVKIPIACTNNPYSYYEQKIFYKISDFLAVHNYGSYCGNSAGGWVRNRSELLFKNGKPGDFPTRMLTVNYKNKPVIVDEWNIGYPIDSRAEVMVMVPGLAALYDYDGLFYFDFFEHYDYLINPEKKKKYYMTSLEQPFSIQTIFLPSISFAFRLFMLPVFTDSIVVNVDRAEGELIQQFRFNPFPGLSSQIYFQKRVILSYEKGVPYTEIVEKLEKKSKIVLSNFVWDWEKGYIGLHSDKFAAFAGILDSYCKLGNIVIRGDKEFVVLTIASLDTLNLSKSKKILITVGADAITKGDKLYTAPTFNGEKPIMYWFLGKESQRQIERIPGISYIKPVSINIFIKKMNGDISNIRAFSLDFEGNKKREIPLLYYMEGFEINIMTGESKTPYYLIEER